MSEKRNRRIVRKLMQNMVDQQVANDRRGQTGTRLGRARRAVESVSFAVATYEPKEKT